MYTGADRVKRALCIIKWGSPQAIHPVRPHPNKDTSARNSNSPLFLHRFYWWTAAQHCHHRQQPQGQGTSFIVGATRPSGQCNKYFHPTPTLQGCTKGCRGYTRTHVHTYTHTHVHWYTCTHVHTYTCTHVQGNHSCAATQRRWYFRHTYIRTNTTWPSKTNVGSCNVNQFTRESGPTCQPFLSLCYYHCTIEKGTITEQEGRSCHAK